MSSFKMIALSLVLLFPPIMNNRWPHYLNTNSSLSVAFKPTFLWSKFCKNNQTTSNNSVSLKWHHHLALSCNRVPTCAGNVVCGQWLFQENVNSFRELCQMTPVFLWQHTLKARESIEEQPAPPLGRLPVASFIEGSRQPCYTMRWLDGQQPVIDLFQFRWITCI